MQEKGGSELLDIFPACLCKEKDLPLRSCRGFPKPPVRRTSLTMSDCEGLPVGKRQIYIYPGVLPTASHSQIAKSHAEPLVVEGSRSRSRESRNSLKTTADPGAVP